MSASTTKRMTAPPFGERREMSAEALDALYATGHRLHAQGRYREAAPLFRAMVMGATADERGYLALGACHEGLEQPMVALEIYGAATIAAVAPRCWLARARLLRSLGRDDEAHDAIAEADLLAEALDDESVRALVVAERGESCSE